MINMNLELLQVGTKVKYPMLCQAFGEKPKTGNSKPSQLKEFEKYVRFEKEDTWFHILEIYDQPLEKATEKEYQVHYHTKHAEIILKRKDVDYVVLIDLEDVEQVITKRWYITEKGYVKSRDGFSLHRFVMNIEKSKTSYSKDKPVVHHINHNPLDNRKCNLQIMSWEDHVKLHSVEGEGRVRKVEKEVEELVLKLKEVLMENDIDLDSPTLAKAIKHISKYGFEDEKAGAWCWLCS